MDLAYALCASSMELGWSVVLVVKGPYWGRSEAVRFRVVYLICVGVLKREVAVIDTFGFIYHFPRLQSL